jgi:hypothetical protein
MRNLLSKADFMLTTGMLLYLIRVSWYSFFAFSKLKNFTFLTPWNFDDNIFKKYRTSLSELRGHEIFHWLFFAFCEILLTKLEKTARKREAIIGEKISCTRGLGIDLNWRVGSTRFRDVKILSNTQRPPPPTPPKKKTRVTLVKAPRTDFCPPPKV